MPERSGRVGAPAMTAKPATATPIAAQVLGRTGSPTTRPSSAATSGTSAWMTRTFATEVSLSAVMNDADEAAMSAAIASPGRPMARKAREHPAPLGDRDEREDGEDRERRPPGDLGGQAHVQLPLQDPGQGPHRRGQRDVDRAERARASPGRRHSHCSGPPDDQTPTSMAGYRSSRCKQHRPAVSRTLLARYLPESSTEATDQRPVVDTPSSPVTTRTKQVRPGGHCVLFRSHTTPNGPR